ncbi:class I SAM-dependent methyltransferase [Streptomyces palmae]|uniref:Class I SAM-dependent methyltransferase n=1 Tax=Streptomyces palmae TaxID=1701085 RepID=A0A4Z0GYV2_9ACTN|nr:class I SAM-dependent methyltransferase [Streptomyces palmae]TGB02544.1 class I SAM-dependent methyltransferase [Streptomyces palmae]
MTRIVNTDQAEAWNGYEGQHWAAHADRYDAVNSGFNEPLLTAAGIGARDRILDIGCGNGQLTRLAARRAPEGHALGVDLSAPMLATARARTEAEGLSRVRYVRDDAQTRAFPEGGFDLALSRFGIMFFADPVAAFDNIRRALRPGGRLAFLAMTGLAGTELGEVFAAMARHLPWPTGPDGTGPTSFADPGRTDEVLTAAGFGRIAVREVSADQVWGRDAADAAAFLGDFGPVAHQLRQVGPEVAANARAALTEALRPFTGPEGVRIRSTAWLVTAVHPER